MLINMKTREDVYVRYDSRDMRYSEYIQLMWSMDRMLYVTDEELAEIIKRENEILKSA